MKIERNNIQKYKRLILISLIIILCQTVFCKDKPAVRKWKDVFTCTFTTGDKCKWDLADAEKRKAKGLGLNLVTSEIDEKNVLDVHTAFSGTARINAEITIKGPFAVEMMVKAIGKPSDLSIFMDSPGNGVGLQFGSGRNEYNAIWSYGYGKDGTKAEKHLLPDGLLVRRNTWYKVRLEVRNNRVFGFVNSKLLGTRKLGKKYDWQKSFIPMLYFFDTHVLINSITVQTIPATPENTEKLLPEDNIADYVPPATKKNATLSKKLPSDAFTNKSNITMLPVKAGSFLMGDNNSGDADEKPAHKVTITKSFFMSQTEITNKQYEEFDPEHKKKRGIKGLSKEDDEAVVNVSWNDAVKFCDWMSKKEGKNYRLPTEAEWEYACRAGTDTLYFTGDNLSKIYYKEQKLSWNPYPVSTKVKSTPPNSWGFHDMHGNVEEWCSDWYGPYTANPQTDPIGRENGSFKITRGGSHNTPPQHLRSSNRLGTLPSDGQWLIGFRIVMGKALETKPLPAMIRPLIDETIKQNKFNWRKNIPDVKTQYFKGPIPFVNIPENSNGPLFSRHNHVPAITYCPNGDLLAIWISCNAESDREMSMGMSRLRAGADQWDNASPFWYPPGRNLGGCALFTDKEGTIFHFNGLNTKGSWANLSIILRTSIDNGKTWTRERIIFKHGSQNQVIRGVIKTQKGKMIVLGDAGINSNTGRSESSTALHISNDDGKTWYNSTENSPNYDLQAGISGHLIYGLHGAIVELSDGRWMGFGRSNPIKEKMPQSISGDEGKTWKYQPGPFKPHGMARRIAFIKLRDGTLFYAGFSNGGMTINNRKVTGLFGALSYDDGKTWPVQKLITDGKPNHKIDGGGNTHIFTMGPDKAEPAGYLDCVQTPDEVIHLISSRLYYTFNKKWIETPSTKSKNKLKL